jgi:predicted unusual protein kinase regulating ubiquinone biosynthesis (AarF/ABC1/UbiB family)
MIGVSALMSRLGSLYTFLCVFVHITTNDKTAHMLGRAAGKGFVNELDYQEEALNGEYFSEAIKLTPLADVVFAPKVLRDYTTGRVLTTEWVVGERLEKSNAADVSALCSIAMNSYLTVCTYSHRHIDP